MRILRLTTVRKNIDLDLHNYKVLYFIDRSRFQLLCELIYKIWEIIWEYAHEEGMLCWELSLLWFIKRQLTWFGTPRLTRHPHCLLNGGEEMSVSSLCLGEHGLPQLSSELFTSQHWHVA